MKVLHVINSLGLGGGAEKSVVGMLPLLAERGIESSVVCLRSREGGLQAEVEAAGYPLEALTSMNLGGRARQLRAVITRQQPDLVHASMYFSCMTSRLACVRTGVPLVNSFVNLNYDRERAAEPTAQRLKHEVVRHLDGFTARHLVTRVHAVSATVEAMAVDALGIDPAAITVIPRGRSRDVLGSPGGERRAAARSALGVDDGAFVVLTVGRQDPVKGQAVLAEAFGRAAASIPGAVLLIAGREGPASADLHRVIDAAGDGVDIRVLGHRDDVPELLAAADLFAFPSFSEGIPGSVIEAMAMGVPVVGSDAPSVTDVLGGGRYGVVVPKGDVAALEGALAELAADADRRRALADAGLARFDEAYEIGTVADATVAFYREVVERGR